MSAARPSRSRKEPERLASAPADEPKKRAASASASASPTKAKKVKETPAKEKKAAAGGKKAAAGGKKAKGEKKADKQPRALTPYMLFAKDARPGIKAKHADATFGEIGRLLGEAWAALSASEKKKYEDASAKEKARLAKA